VFETLISIQYSWQFSPDSSGNPFFFGKKERLQRIAGIATAK
jgi:hypothetical protein